MLTLLAFFFTGLIQDFLVTLNWRYVAKQKIAPAALMSCLTTFVGMTVFYNIIKDNCGLVAILVYALGVAVGTIVAMKCKWGFGDKK